MTDRTRAVDAAFAASVSEEVARRAQQDTPPSLPVGKPVGVAVPVPDEPAKIEADEDALDWRDWTMYLPSWLASMVTHLVLVLILALVTTLTVVRDVGPSLVVSADNPGVDEGQPEELSTELTAADDQLQTEAEPLAPLPELAATALDTGPIKPILPTGEIRPSGGSANADALLANIEGNGLEARLNGALRDELVRSGGGTPESERAVLLALQWLAAHQEYNGSWSFQHQTHPRCNGACENPGYTPGRIASTSLALLPFLGTGQTHKEGQYKHTIDKGLKFLVSSISRDGKLGSLWDPHAQMYGHGMASIVLCEAYGMTHDPALREPAQSTIDFIVEAQDPQGGGWRYFVRTPGDTSVVGWQLMALKSAQMAYLQVPQNTLRKAGYFLDSVQAQGGAVYGYRGPEMQRPTTTSIGLLCRMYLGWGRDVRPLARGVQILDTLGPSTDKTATRNDMYYDYYATQVMHHWGGYPWQRWNAVMRDYLVRSQSTQGHELGSWFFAGSDPGSMAGGRLYCTAMAAMILEVYYRHMPLYREKLVKD